MSKDETDLRGLEKRAYLTWHRDGLADLGLGILVILFGIGMKYDMTLLAPIYGCVGYPIWLLLKQRITERRLGWVAFGERRKRREKRGWTLMFVAGCAVLVGCVVGYRMVLGGSGFYFPGYLLISIIFIVISSSLGAVLELARLQVYSGILLLMGVSGHVFEWRPETGILLPGLIIAAAGLALLTSFLMKYPVESGNGELPEDGSAGQEQ